MKRYYSHVMSTLALFVALGGGAYAATMVKTANNALHLGGVPARSFDQDVMEGTNANNVKLSNPSGPTQIVTGKLFNSGRAGAAFTTFGDVNVENPGSEPVNFTLLLSLNNKTEPFTFTSTINPGSRLSVPAFFAFEPKCKKCGLLNLGNNEVQLLGEVTGKGELVVSDSSIFALRPIVIPPGRSFCCGPMPMPGAAGGRVRGRIHQR
jgi:hypothetical protein